MLPHWVDAVLLRADRSPRRFSSPRAHRLSPTDPKQARNLADRRALLIVRIADLDDHRHRPLTQAPAGALPSWLSCAGGQPTRHPQKHACSNAVHTTGTGLASVADALSQRAGEIADGSVDDKVDDQQGRAEHRQL
jgi:hypothetical protein